MLKYQMRNFFTLLIWALGLGGGYMYGQVSSWSATYSGASNQICPYTQSNFTLPAVSGLSFSQVTRGAGLVCASATNGIAATDWMSVDSITASGSGDYFEFNITSFCPAYNLDSIRYVTQSSAGGPSQAYALVSVNGGAFTAFGSAFTIGNLGGAFTRTIIGNTVNVPQGGSLRVRIFAFGAGSGADTHRVSNGTIFYLKTIDPSAAISGTQTICSGSNASLTINFTGSGPWDIIYSDGVNSTGINGIITNPYILTVNPTVNRTYTVASVVSVCSGTVSGSAAVTVTPAISNNLVTPNQTLCVGNTSSIITGTTPGGGNGTYAYQWEVSTDMLNWNPMGGATGINFNPGVASTTFYLRRQVSSGSCPPSTSSKVDFVILPAFSSNTITASQTICSGNTASFAGSTPTGGSGTYNYQWQSSPDNSTWVNASGGMGINFISSALNSNFYFRRIAQTSTCTPLTSGSVSVAVEPGPGNNQIGVSQAICLGSTAAPFTGTIPTGGNGSYTYLWQSSTDNANFFDCGLGNGVGYSAGMILTNTYFRRVVSSGSCPGSTSLPLFLRPDPPVSGNTVSSNQTLCAGTSATLLTGSTPTGGFGGYGYQWQTSPDDITWTNITGAVADTYNPGAPVASRYYRRIISSGACQPVTSNNVWIAIEAPITSNTLNSNQTICTGSLAPVITGSLPTGGIGTYSYTWQSSPDGFVWNPLTGEVSQNYAPLFQNTTVRYRRIVSSGICPASTSAPVILVINQLIANNSIAMDQTLCSGNTPVQMTGTLPSGGNGSFSYQWISSTDNSTWSNHPGAFNAFLQPGVMSVSTYYRRVVISGACNPDSSAFVLLNVYPAPGPNVISASQTLCGTQIPQVLSGTVATGGQGGIFYEWLWMTDSVTWVPYTDGTAADLNPDPLTTSAFFARVLTSGTCDNDTSNIVEIILQAAPGDNIIGPDQTICAGSLPGFLTGAIPTGGSGVYLYQWESSQDTMITWNSISGASMQDFQPPVDANTIWYRRIVNAGSTCVPDTLGVVKVQVNNPPSAVLTGDQSICESYSAQLSINLSGGTPPWNVTYLDGTSMVTVTGLTNSVYTFNVTPSTHTTYKLLGVNDICPGFYSGEPVVVVHQRPWAVLSNDQTICTPGSVVITITMYGPGPWDLDYTDGAGVTSVVGITANPYLLTVYPMATTTYKLTRLYDGRCSRTDHSNSSVITGYSSSPPLVSFTHQRNANTVWFTNTTTNADSYLWHFGDGNTSSLKDPYHYYFFNGNYQVKLVAYNVCTSDSIFQVIGSVSRENLTEGEIPEIYPNPATDFCYFRLNTGDAAKRMELMSLEGKSLGIIENPASDDSGLYQVDLRQYPAGMYLLAVETDKGMLVGRVKKIE